MAGKNHEAWDLNLPSANSLHKIILVQFRFILRQMLRIFLIRKDGLIVKASKLVPRTPPRTPSPVPWKLTLHELSG